VSFEEFEQTAWTDHGDQTEAVAQRLRDSLHRVIEADQVAPYAGLIAHVFGEHLGEWDAGITLLHALRDRPAGHANTQTLAMLARQEATLRHAAGDAPPFDALGNDDRIAALASAASMLAARADWARAIGSFEQALAGASVGLARSSPANRALAVVGNNLAAALEEKSDRSAEHTRAMLVAARTGLSYWRIAGTWLEEERAQYRLARSCLQAGNAGGAVQAALDCIAVCEANEAPAFERFFGHAVLALAQGAAGNTAVFERSRQAARHWVEQVPQDERAWCDAELAELEAN